MAFFTANENYNERHDVYRKRSGALISNNDLLKYHLPQVIQSILQRKTVQDKLNILSVGSASGQSDFQILKIVQEELNSKEDYQQVKIFNRAVEPNGRSLRIYKADFEKISSLSKDERISVELCEKTFEEYKDEVDREDNIKFDIIHFIHSLYYVDVEAALTNCMEKQLTENGRFVCILGGKEKVPLECFKQLHKGLEENESESPLTLSEKVLEIADKHYWKYETFSQEFYVDITDIFDEESREGNLLLDFMMQKINFRSTTSEEEVNETMKGFRESSRETNGKRMILKEDLLIIIYK